MKVVDVNLNDDGSYDFNVQATEEETGKLIMIALNILTQWGYVRPEIFDEEEDFEVDLATIPIERFYSA